MALWLIRREGFLLVKKGMTSNLRAFFLIYSNGMYGISAVTSIRGTVLIFNIVMKELHTHTDIFQMNADFHFLKTCL